MKTKTTIFIFLVLLALILPTPLIGQTHCFQDRFSETDYFPPSDILALYDATYGAAPDSGGTQVSLLYDLYMPNPAVDTLDSRPFILMVHGGSWQGGTKSGLEGSARYYAGKGYVCAVIDYRVGWDWDSASVECTGDSLDYAEARLGGS